MARILFVLLLVWPPVHAVASRRLGFSPWRFFGWGMYSAPHPESLAELQLFWRERDGSLTEIPYDPRVEARVSHILHFGLQRQMKSLATLVRKKNDPRPVVAMLLRQRADIGTARAYIEKLVMETGSSPGLTPEKKE